MEAAKSSEAPTTRFSKSGTVAICMDASMAVNHQAVKERPDHGEEDEHRGEEGDGASGMELIFFAGRYRHFVRYRTAGSSAARAAPAAANAAIS
jgi:hypothetical protein